MSQLELINMGEVARQEVDWLYYPYLPFGKISIVQGDPGEGKTLLMMAIIARLSRGEPLFSEAFGREPMTCIYQTAEDGLCRLLVAGAAAGSSMDVLYFPGIRDSVSDGIGASGRQSWQLRSPL